MKKIYAILAILLLAIATYFTVPYWTRETKEVKVLSTLVKPYGHESKYIVFTDNGVYENTDTWAYFKFDSSDLQAKLLQPGRFKITYYGFRVPFFSKYQNITSVQRIQ